MIEPTPRNAGVPRVNVICDDCGRSETVSCDYSRSQSGGWTPNEGQARNKITKQGWAEVKGKLRCPKCEAKRKVAPEKPREVEPMKPQNVTLLRQPTPKQKREIIAILEEVYDDDLKRYRGHETDKNVAETLEGGVMPGWVAEIREDMFGPAGHNDEVESLMAEISEWRKEREKENKNARLHIENAEAIVRKSEDEIAKAAGFESRLAAIVKNFGPKAGRA